MKKVLAIIKLILLFCVLHGQNVTVGSINTRMLSGTIIPNGVIIGNVGDIYYQNDAGVGRAWKKKTGNGTQTGWIEVADAQMVLDSIQAHAGGGATTPLPPGYIPYVGNDSALAVTGALHYDSATATTTISSYDASTRKQVALAVGTQSYFGAPLYGLSILYGDSGFAGNISSVMTINASVFGSDSQTTVIKNASALMSKSGSQIMMGINGGLSMEWQDSTESYGGSLQFGHDYVQLVKDYPSGQSHMKIDSTGVTI